MNTDDMIANVPLNEKDLIILMDLTANDPKYKTLYDKIFDSHIQLKFKKKCISSFEKKHRKSIMTVRSTFEQTLKLFKPPNIEGDVISYDEY